MEKSYYVADRVAGKGNPWSIVRPGALERSRARDTLRWCRRVTGRQSVLLHIEPVAKFTPEVFAELTARGILPQ